jgi:peptidoglycan/LPS O-acetylase OafA/YrhL
VDDDRHHGKRSSGQRASESPGPRRPERAEDADLEVEPGGLEQHGRTGAEEDEAAAQVAHAETCGRRVPSLACAALEVEQEVEQDRAGERPRLPGQDSTDRGSGGDPAEPIGAASETQPSVGEPERGAQNNLLVLGGHRDDIQGLRAVAVLLVVLAHAGVGFLRGGYVGVDVFFVLSGFLITGILLSGAAKRGYVSLSDFYVRRARRILPAAALTLVATDLAAYYLLNFVRARQAVSDSIWASVFAANIDFARHGTDYFSQGQPPSPIQHFWSLAVEEQFYLVWPALLSLVLFGAVFSRRPRRNRQAGTITRAALYRLLVVIVLVATASLAWSIHSTKIDPAATYFSTFARAWELALGAALAIAAPSLRRFPAGLGAAMGWLGVVGIVYAAVTFSDNTPFPGSAALLPTVGAALVIGAGIREEQFRLGAGRILALTPLRYVGDRSYAFYLWHWPVLIIAVQYAGHELAVGVKLLMVLGAFMLSILSYGLFENPIRQMRWPAPAGALLWPASAAVVLVVAGVTLGSIDGKAGRLEAAAAAIQPAPLEDPTLAASLSRANSKALPVVIAAVKAARRGAPIPSPLTPPVSKLLDDVYFFPEGCAPKPGQTSAKICRLGDTTSTKTLVVMGDSHMQMWMPTILRMAQRDGWVVLPIVKSACTPGSWLHYPAQPECPAWYRWAKQQAEALHPDVTLITGNWGTNTPVDAGVKAIASLTTAMKRFSTSVIVVGDSPRESREPVDCLLAKHASMRTCSTKATKVQLDGDIRVAAGARKHGIGFMDTRGWFCARTSTTRLEYLCPLVINRTITHRDRGHITQTYGLELMGPFRGAFRRALFQ